MLISCRYNSYQSNKINNYKSNLTSIASRHLQRFAGYSSNISDENILAVKYASLVAAQEAYRASRDTNTVPSEEWSSSLSGLLFDLEILIVNDKDKFKKVFQKADSSYLLFKISDNFEDKLL